MERGHGLADGRAGLYSLGVMLYELTAGRLPFAADNAVTAISQHLHAPVVPPHAQNADTPPALDRLIVRLLSKKSRTVRTRRPRCCASSIRPNS